MSCEHECWTQVGGEPGAHPDERCVCCGLTRPIAPALPPVPARSPRLVAWTLIGLVATVLAAIAALLQR